MIKDHSDHGALNSLASKDPLVREVILDITDPDHPKWMYLFSNNYEGFYSPYWLTFILLDSLLCYLGELALLITFSEVVFLIPIVIVTLYVILPLILQNNLNF